jgi:hypothetical protein
MDEYLEAVSIYDRLCEDRRHHSFWSANIVDASKILNDPIAWQNFYTYLSDKNHRFVNKMLPTLGDAIDNGTVGDPYKNDPNEYDYERFQNGNVHLIHVIPRDDEKMEEKMEEKIEDEKLDSL